MKNKISLKELEQLNELLTKLDDSTPQLSDYNDYFNEYDEAIDNVRYIVKAVKKLTYNKIR